MVNWIPLESNPQLLTDFGKSVGMTSAWAFHDVWGLEPDLLAFVPTPCKAVLLLFPHNNKEMHVAHREEQDRIERDGQVVSENLFYMKQCVGNACGTVAAIHALANNSDTYDEGFLRAFIDRVQKLAPLDRGEELGKEATIQEVSEEVAQTGDTEAPPADASTGHHFICFVAKDGHLYELDGGKRFPVNHGTSSEETLLLDTANIVKEKFLKYDPDSIEFSLLALADIPDQ